MPFRLLPDGSVERELARSLVVEGTTAVLTLDGREWSDGRAITAADVVASIERARPPSGFAQIDTARALSRLEVEMQGDIGDWESVLARGAFVLPRGRLAGGNVSGSSFRFERYVPSRSLSYVANEDAPSPPLLDRVKVSFVQSTELLVRLLDAGDIDVAAVPMSVNLDVRLAELQIPYASRVADERVVLMFDEGRVGADEAKTIVDSIHERNLVTSFIRDDGTQLAPEVQGNGSLPGELSIAAPEGDELLNLLQRAIQLDLDTSGVEVELITAPVSSMYGSWPEDAPTDAALLRIFTERPATGFRWPLASVATLIAWREGVGGIEVLGGADGPLWNVWEWWVEPSI